MNATIKVHEPGSVVTIECIAARIRAVRIGSQLEVFYLLAWMHDGKVVEEWFPDDEMPHGGASIDVTFKGST